MKKACILVALLPAALFADDIYLKGAGKVSGRIVQRTATAVEIDVGAGTVTIPLDHIERIQEGRSPLDDYHDRAARLAPTDVQGWLRLAQFASGQGLSKQAEEAYGKVLAVAPDNAEANQGLGRVQLDGRWVTEEEGYRARGYVQFEGEWMMPAEQQAILHERSTQAAADRRVEEAETRAADAEAKAQAAEARAKEAEAANDPSHGNPLWWGGWGPGPTAWVGPTFKVSDTAGRGPR
jgi:tetratricopeptide (TPR) repeat protein